MELEKLNDEEIIKLAESSEGMRRFYLYPELAKRASNEKIREILFNDILDKEKRQMDLSPRGGIIKLAWMPLLEILRQTDNSIKSELKSLLESWSESELENLKFYLKGEPELLVYLF